MQPDHETESGTTRPRHLFLSYARPDRERVRLLAEALVEAGHIVWWDALIEGGATFARTIERELEQADAVIVVWSAASVNSDWVRDEAAFGRDRKRLVPVSLDRIEPPLGFRQYHAVDLSNWNRRRDAPEFINLERGIAAAAETKPLRTEPVVQHRVSRRGVILAGTGIAIAAAGGSAAWWAMREGKDAGSSVAVLPFANISQDRDQDYFSEGLSAEVRAALMRITGLKVAAPTSSNEFRDRHDDARTIARKLGVAYLLEGNVRRTGAVVRINATLTDGSTGYAAWSRTFERKLDDIIAVQTEIADAVSGEMLARVETSGDTPGGTAVIAAYDAYLRGRALFNADAGEASDRAAMGRFNEAVKLDPKFAAAHAARSRVIAAMAYLYAQSGQIEGQYRSAIAAARLATRLAPDLAAAHLALGFSTLSGFLDFKGAREAYERAYALAPGDADILLMYAFFIAKVGRHDEAMRVIERAAVLDPLNPRVFRAKALLLIAARQPDASILAARKALAMNPKLSGVHDYLGTALLMQDKPEQAITEFKAESYESPRLAGLAIAERQLGNIAAADAAMALLIRNQGDTANYQQAQILAQQGAVSSALTALERAYAKRDGGMSNIAGDPMLDPLRGEARFRQLLLQMGLA